MIPLVSVIIATHQKTSRLAKALLGLRNQTEKNFEVIVADDASDPQTQTLIDAHTTYLTIKYTQTSKSGKPMGAAFARNCAIAQATAPRTLIIDDDCIAPVHLLAAHAGFGEGAVGAFGLRRHIAEGDHTRIGEGNMHTVSTLPYRKEMRDTESTIANINRLIDAQNSGIRNYLFTCHISYPTATLKQVGGFWQEMRGSGFEDQELGLRMFRAGVRFRFLSDIVVYHQDHKQCVHQANHAARNRMLLHQTMRDPSLVQRKSQLLP